MPKTVPASKFTEWSGLDRIQVVVHEMKCIWRELSKDDFGLDGEIEVVMPKQGGDGYQTTGGIIKVQAKSGTSYVKKDDGSHFATPIRKDDLDYWSACTFPVLFIVYHPEDDALYFKEVKSYIAGTPDVFRPPFQIVFDKEADLFTAACKDSIREQARVSPPRLSFDERERLFSNLLPVEKLPEVLTAAKTRRTSYEHIRSAIDGYKPPFCIHEGRIYTLSDLRHEKNVLRPFCNVRTITDVAVSQWLVDDALTRNLIFMLNQLLGSHCYRCGLRYNPHFKRTYFPRDNDEDTSFVRSWTSPRTGASAPRTVVQYYEYGKLTFWRHLAVELFFRRCSSSWYLEIHPKYLFTDDGKKPCDPEIVGPYTTSLKADEHNIRVLNHVLFWAQALADGKPRIEMTLFGAPLVVVKAVPETCFAKYAIPLDPASYEEPSPSNQLRLFGWDDEEDDSGGD